MNKAKRLIEEVKSIKNSDNIILNYTTHKADENKVNLHYYHAEWQTGADANETNLGDYLSEVVVRWMCSQCGINFEKIGLFGSLCG